MKRLKTSARISLGLGILSILAVLVCYLALTDINHGEGDLKLEWACVQIGFTIFILFIFSTFVTLFHLFNYLKIQEDKK